MARANDWLVRYSFQGDLMTTLLVAAMLISAAPSAPSGASPHPFFTRSYWAAFDWASPETARELAGLPPYPAYDPAKDRTLNSKVVRRGPLAVGALQVDASIMERDDGAYAFPKGIRLDWPEAAVSGENCRSAAAMLERNLGAPNVKNDFSFQLDVRYTILRMQWEIGPSRANLYCLIFDYGDLVPPSGAIVFHAWHIDTGIKDRDPAWIRCTQKLRVTSGLRVVSEEELPPIVLIIDDGLSKAVYTGDRVPFGKATFTDGRISIVRKREEGRFGDEVILDRRTGHYHETRTREGNGMAGTVTGECTAFDPAKPKF